MVRVRMVITPDAQIAFGRFAFGAQIIARIQFHAVVARVLAYVFERQYLADSSRAVFDHAQQQTAALFGESPLAVAFDLVDLFRCQFDAHWWLVVGGWWLVVGIRFNQPPTTNHQPPFLIPPRISRSNTCWRRRTGW